MATTRNREFTQRLWCFIDDYDSVYQTHLRWLWDDMRAIGYVPILGTETECIFNDEDIMEFELTVCGVYSPEHVGKIDYFTDDGYVSWNTPKNQLDKS